MLCFFCKMGFLVVLIVPDHSYENVQFVLICVMVLNTYGSSSLCVSWDKIILRIIGFIVLFEFGVILAILVP